MDQPVGPAAASNTPALHRRRREVTPPPFHTVTAVPEIEQDREGRTNSGGRTLPGLRDGRPQARVSRRAVVAVVVVVRT